MSTLKIAAIAMLIIFICICSLLYMLVRATGRKKDDNEQMKYVNRLSHSR